MAESWGGKGCTQRPAGNVRSHLPSVQPPTQCLLGMLIDSAGPGACSGIFSGWAAASTWPRCLQLWLGGWPGLHRPAWFSRMKRLGSQTSAYEVATQWKHESCMDEWMSHEWMNEWLDEPPGRGWKKNCFNSRSAKHGKQKHETHYVLKESGQSELGGGWDDLTPGLAILTRLSTSGHMPWVAAWKPFSRVLCDMVSDDSDHVDVALCTSVLALPPPSSVTLTSMRLILWGMLYASLQGSTCTLTRFHDSWMSEILFSYTYSSYNYFPGVGVGALSCYFQWRQRASRTWRLGLLGWIPLVQWQLTLVSQYVADRLRKSEVDNSN